MNYSFTMHHFKTTSLHHETQTIMGPPSISLLQNYSLVRLFVLAPTVNNKSIDRAGLLGWHAI
jgi:hypothetical protein